jgi:histidine ammonia-lyase
MGGHKFRIPAFAGMTIGLIAVTASAAEYRPIAPTMADKTIVLDGHDMTVEQAIDIARYGAKVQIAPEARQRTADTYGLLLEGAAEGISIYRFNRGAGAQREVVTFTGDPLSPENHAAIEQREADSFAAGPTQGFGPEVADEEIVRALMAVRANNITYEAISPQFLDMLVALLNNRITPVYQTRGTLGEADLLATANIMGTMVGKGDAYYRGQRMKASEALQRAGLKPLTEVGLYDANVFVSTNAYATGQAALLVEDGRLALEWADLIDAMDMNGMNSSITPLTLPVQAARPQRWLNWNAARILDMLKGSYLLQDDPHRIIQDPESLRASSIRQGSAWKAWAALRDSTLFQMNSSDQNPVVRVGLSPKDSWELSTPQMMKYYVKGGKYSNGQHGYIVSNANWDPYPLANDIEAFTNALANAGVAVALRQHRFTSTFFTVQSPAEILKDQPAPPGGYAPGEQAFVAAGLWQNLQSVAPAIAPEGFSTDVGVGDLEAQTQIKAERARQAVGYMFDLLSEDVLTASYWLDLRKIQEPSRNFGAAPTAAWQAFRKALPFRLDPANKPERPAGNIAVEFLKANPAANFYPAGPAMPSAEPVPDARPRAGR